MNNLPPIKCAICDKPVEQITTEYDYCYARTKITVQCHGETDQMTLNDEFIIDGGLDRLEEGLAFNLELQSAITKTKPPHQPLKAIKSLQSNENG